MRILIACEFSGIVRDAFAARGHDAWSCDLLPTERPGQHIEGDVLEVLGDGWDLMVAHPPCTYLTVAGNRWFNESVYGKAAIERRELREKAVGFVNALWEAPIAKVAIENPVGYLSTMWAKADQIIQPWEFGDEESKRTALWLKMLYPLRRTKIVTPKVYGYMKRGKHEGGPIYFHSMLRPGKDRAQDRSRFWPGIAEAMANQWG